MARTLAKQFAKDFEIECGPFQYALSTRAGTDCVGHMLRAATDSDAAATVLSVDGIGAYDHVSRSAMLERLIRMPKARAILLFVRLSYGQPSTYSWWDQNGVKRAVSQAEGGEQGDPLMPLLFSIGIQGALEEVAGTLEAGEQLCAFLDDIFVLCQPHRVKTLNDELARCLFRVAGIHLHQGKTRVWTRRGSPRVLLCWEPLSGALSSSLESCKQELRRSAGCGRRFPQCQICNVGVLMSRNFIRPHQRCGKIKT